MCIILLGGCCFTHAKYGTQLINLFYNKGDVQSIRLGDKEIYKDLEKAPEVCNVVFYFSHWPIVSFVPENKKRTGVNEKKVFIFPKATLTDKLCRKMSKKMKKESNADLDLQLEKIKRGDTGPIDGVKFVVNYNPKKIRFVYDKQSTTSEKKAIVFHFYSNEFKEKMEKIHNAVLQVTYNKKKRVSLLIADMVDRIVAGKAVLG